MTSSLQQRVQQVARCAGRLVRIYGASWFLAVVFLAALGIGVLDFLFRFQDAGIRLMLSTLLWILVLWSFYRFVVTAWQYRCTALQAAHRIECRFPRLRDRLSIAIAFAGQGEDDETGGSLELRRALVTETEAETAEEDFFRCLDRRPHRRALAVAGGTIGLVVVLAFLDGPTVGLAARRMLMPWGSDHWPRRHVLRFVSPPARLAAGSDFEAELVDVNGRLPDHVRIHYWYDGDTDEQVQTEEMQPLGDRLMHRQSNVTRSFRYRATGGDDQDMPWIALQVIEPPRIVSQEITLFPPGYSGALPGNAEGTFRALEGTRVSIRTRVNKPLVSASLDTDTSPAGRSIPLTLDADRLGFALDTDAPIPWSIARSGTYGFRLVDRQGLESGASERWEVQVVIDNPPTVSLERPATDVPVTIRSAVDLEAVVKDDLAVRVVELRFTTSNQPQSEQVVGLWQGPEHVSTARDRDQEDGVQRLIRHTWDLSGVKGLSVGQWVEFHVMAEDYKPQSGRSATRRLTIISAEELEDRVGQRQSDILAQIAEAARLQRQTRSQTGDLAIQLREVGALDRDDIDQLQSAELNQRQVQQRLGRPADGIEAQIMDLLASLNSNRLDIPDVARRLEALRAATHALNTTTLPQIQHELVDALKVARAGIEAADSDAEPGAGARAELAQLIHSAGDHQQEVVAALDKMLGELAQWDSYRRLAREVAQLRREQEQVRAKTDKLRWETLTKDINELSAEQRADVKRLAEQQHELSRRFDRLQSRLETTQRKLQDADPLAAATLGDARDMIRRDGVAATMRDAGRHIENNQLGQAAEQEDTAIKLLGVLQDALANRREHQLDRMAKQLRKAAGQVSELQSRQKQVQRELRDSPSPDAKQLDKLAEQETDLANQAGQLARRLKRLQARGAETALNQAAQHLAKAAQAGKQRQPQPLAQQADQAQNQLDQAQQELQRTLDNTQESLRRERLTQLKHRLLETQGQQQELLARTAQVDQTRPPKASDLDAGRRESIRLLADRQEELEAEVALMAEELSDLAAFSIALQGIASDMAAAGAQLDMAKTGAVAQRFQQSAVDHIQQVLETLQKIPPEPARQGEQTPRQGPPAPGQQQGEQRFLLAQLKMIRMMQQEINQQTASLEKTVGQTKAWGELQVRRQQQLTQRQAALADVLLQLLDKPAGKRTPAPAVGGGQGLDDLDRALERDRQGPPTDGDNKN